MTYHIILLIGITHGFFALQRMEKQYIYIYIYILERCGRSRTNLYPKNVSAFAEMFGTFWSITFEYPDLVPKQNLQL